MADRLERIYTVPLSGAYDYIRTRRAKRAVKLLREFVLRHMKADALKISAGVNSLLWRDSMQKPPRRVKVRVVREEGTAHVWLLGEEEEAKMRQEEKKKAAEAKKKEDGEKKPAASAAKPEEPAQTTKTGGLPKTQEAQRGGDTGGQTAAQKLAEKEKPPEADKPAAAQNPKAADMKQPVPSAKNTPVKPKTA